MGVGVEAAAEEGERVGDPVPARLLPSLTVCARRASPAASPVRVAHIMGSLAVLRFRQCISLLLESSRDMQYEMLADREQRELFGAAKVIQTAWR